MCSPPTPRDPTCPFVQQIVLAHSHNISKKQPGSGVGGGGGGKRGENMINKGNKFSFLKGGLAYLIAFKCINIHIYNQKVAEKKDL